MGVAGCAALPRTPLLFMATPAATEASKIPRLVNMTLSLPDRCEVERSKRSSQRPLRRFKSRRLFASNVETFTFDAKRRRDLKRRNGRWDERFDRSTSHRSGRDRVMFTRRGILLASVAAGVAMNSRGVLGKAAQPATPIKFDVPAGACDCHTHIHADPEKYPFFAGRVYTPELASPQEMSELHRALNIER